MTAGGPEHNEEPGTNVARLSDPRLHSVGDSTPPERTAGGGLSKQSLTWVLVLGLLLGLAAWIAEVDLVALLSADARRQMWSFIADGIPPNVSREYLLGRTLRDGLLWAAVETVAISIVGIVLAVGLAIPLALVGAANVTHRGPLYDRSSPTTRYVGLALHRIARGVLSFLRSVPDLVWGFLFVAAIGLGPFAGALAIGIHNGGVLGKLYADFLEDTDPLPVEAVYSTGATRLQTVVHGMVPQITPTLVSYTLYRWECAIRSATILGFVGAGGLGYYLTITINRLQYPKLLTAIGAVFVLVVSCDYLSSRLRAAMV
ncbi:phosphonate ABC transporter, permease protein PhnE [Natrinema halophilum]|uniref:phosphonate ABC transporter, permease protein PhnE n=1 Tax=Natrinema halophilum TaxID=1699371 RepID=UPI001F18726A|nr:phosphonate ABC transporter, permease protein PhnE [Natrinema halophilum]UHQ96170.1 phosphonate ABC transporter, permease protein PhnE [Natrinema halophilum]